MQLLEEIAKARNNPKLYKIVETFHRKKTHKKQTKRLPQKKLEKNQKEKCSQFTCKKPSFTNHSKINTWNQKNLDNIHKQDTTEYYVNTMTTKKELQKEDKILFETTKKGKYWKKIGPTDSNNKIENYFLQTVTNMWFQN